ncbi:MAG: flagellar filament capping protein FliD, partial [Pseudomonadota bacterium]
QVDTSVSQMLSGNGTVQGAINGAENRMESLGDRYTRMEQSVEQTIGRYREQFSQLDGMIAEMNQTSNYLSNQFASLEAQTGGGG